MDNKPNTSWIKEFSIAYSPMIKKIAMYIVVVLFILRGVTGYWGDLKSYIIQSELGKQTVTVSVDPIKDKNEKIKEKVFKEKGIILSDEDIEKYGISK